MEPESIYAKWQVSSVKHCIDNMPLVVPLLNTLVAMSKEIKVLR